MNSSSTGNELDDIIGVSEDAHAGDRGYLILYLCGGDTGNCLTLSGKGALHDKPPAKLFQQDVYPVSIIFRFLPRAAFASRVTDLTLGRGLGFPFDARDDYVPFLETLGSSLPNLKKVSIQYDGWTDNSKTVQALTRFFQKTPQLESFVHLTYTPKGTVAEFQAWADALQHCSRLSLFHCKVGDDLPWPDSDSSDEEQDQDSSDEEQDQEEPLPEEGLEDSGDEDQTDEEEQDPMPDDMLEGPGDDEGHPMHAGNDQAQPAIAIGNNRIYNTARPQDFEINRCWDSVLRALATANKETLTKLWLLAPANWTESNLLTSETTQAMLSVTQLKWPVIAIGEVPYLSRAEHFPFTLSISGDNIDTVVDYLMRVHSEKGVVTHFIPENPLAGNDSFLKAFISTHGMKLPGFRFMYNGKQDPGRSKDIFVLLSANLVDPDRIKTRLTERLQQETPGQPVRVAMEMIHEPKHLILYRGIQQHNLWEFHPATASDAQFLDMLAVLGNLGPHGSFFHKSVDYGLQMRFNVLSPQRDRLLRWVERLANSSE